MSVEDLILHFVYDDESGDKQFYVPGDMLRGTIHLHLRRDLRVRNMTLLILGGAAVSWEEVGKKKLYTAREEYLQGSKLLLDAGPEDSMELSRGMHMFSFQYQLPSHLPSTFQGVYGSITYVAKVILSPEDEHAETLTSEPFMVLRRPVLPSHVFCEVEEKASRTFFGLMSAGQITIHCRLSRSAAIPGEIIYVNAEVGNWSPRGITLIQAAVVMESTYHAQNSNSKKIVFRQILNKRIDVFDVKNRRGRRWRNVQMVVPPYLPDSNLEGCSVMDVRYFFEYRVQVEGRNDVMVEIPLHVGSHPDSAEDNDPMSDSVARLGQSRGQNLSRIRGVSQLDPAFAGPTDVFSSFSNNDLPWYGGSGGALTEMESVDGDLFAYR